MTRYAKKDKTEHEASSWKDLSKGKSSIQQSHSKSGDSKFYALFVSFDIKFI